MSRLVLAGALLMLAVSPPASIAQTTTTYTYDVHGQLTAVTAPSGATVGYSYDAAGNRIQVSTAGGNTAPVCTNYTMGPISAPAYATVTVSITSAIVLARCTDADGNTMTVLTPTVPYTVTLPPGTMSKQVSFSVSDGNGGTGSGVITVTRT